MITQLSRSVRVESEHPFREINLFFVSSVNQIIFQFPFFGGRAMEGSWRRRGSLIVVAIVCFGECRSLADLILFRCANSF